MTHPFPSGEPFQDLPATATSAPEPHPELRSRRVLIVDDFRDVREMYGEYLGRCGLEVQLARHGAQAIERALAIRPDVILMDLAMPGIDGWEATRVLKQHPNTKHIPIIAVTAHTLPGERERAMRAGCDALLTKPCLPYQVLNEIARVLGSSTVPPE
jgi:two-component system, cell cycle response regulator DivK